MSEDCHMDHLSLGPQPSLAINGECWQVLSACSLTPSDGLFPCLLGETTITWRSIMMSEA